MQNELENGYAKTPYNMFFEAKPAMNGDYKHH